MSDQNQDRTAKTETQLVQMPPTHSMYMHVPVPGILYRFTMWNFQTTTTTKRLECKPTRNQNKKHTFAHANSLLALRILCKSVNPQSTWENIQRSEIKPHENNTKETKYSNDWTIFGVRLFECATFAIDLLSNSAALCDRCCLPNISGAL